MICKGRIQRPQLIALSLVIFQQAWNSSLHPSSPVHHMHFQLFIIIPQGQQHVNINSCVLICYLYLSSWSFNHQNCRSALFRQGMYSFSLETVSQELHMSSSQAMSSLSLGHRWRQRKESVTPYPLPMLCSIITITKQFISEILISWTQLVATPETELGHTYAVVFNLSWFADLYLHFPMEVQTQVWKTAVNAVTFFPTSLHRLSSMFHRPSGPCFPPAGELWPSPGVTWPNCLFAVTVTTSHLGMALLSALGTFKPPLNDFFPKPPSKVWLCTKHISIW